MPNLIRRQILRTTQPLPTRPMHQHRLQTIPIIHRWSIVFHILLNAIFIFPLPIVLIEEHGEVDPAQYTPISGFVGDYGRRRRGQRDFVRRRVGIGGVERILFRIRGNCHVVSDSVAQHPHGLLGVPSAFVRLFHRLLQLAFAEQRVQVLRQFELGPESSSVGGAHEGQAHLVELGDDRVVAFLESLVGEFFGFYEGIPSLSTAAPGAAVVRFPESCILLIFPLPQHVCE
mmetsp:Transcript_16369/g.24866  ORF Transcript_16369/g.24866 Transcript_16369/m.24866 type:complete len:230 (-) Transcript_16369:431-1120(-)